MTPPPAPGGETRVALAAGVGSYVIWGLVPLLFQLLGHYGASPWEILAQRIVWAVPAAVLFVALAGQGAQVRAAFRDPGTLKWLVASSLLIGVNWCVYIWAVNSGRVLETSLGYYINPLLNMAAGAVIFRERIDRLGALAIALATVGVGLQAAALGHLPWVSLTLAVTFCGYGIVRKRVAADAQTGLLVECLILVAPALAYIVWLQQSGAGHFGHDAAVSLWLVLAGPATAIPLVLFAWAARRIPFSVMGFLQFIAPTMTFILGTLQGERFTALRAVSFAVIWLGVAVFLFGAWRRSRAVRQSVRDTLEAAAE